MKNMFLYDYTRLKVKMHKNTYLYKNQKEIQIENKYDWCVKYALEVLPLQLGVSYIINSPTNCYNTRSMKTTRPSNLLFTHRFRQNIPLLFQFMKAEFNYTQEQL